MIGATAHNRFHSGIPAIPVQLVQTWKHSESTEDGETTIDYITNSGTSGDYSMVLDGDVMIAFITMTSRFSGWLDSAKTIYENNSSYDTLLAGRFGGSNQQAVHMIYATTANGDGAPIGRGPYVVNQNYTGSTAYISQWFLFRNLNGYALKAQSNPNQEFFPAPSKSVIYNSFGSDYYAIHTSMIGDQQYLDQSLVGVWDTEDEIKLNLSYRRCQQETAWAKKSGTWNRSLLAQLDSGTILGNHRHQTAALQVW